MSCSDYVQFSQNSINVFSCSYPGCSKIFTTKFSLQRHRFIHTGDKPFPCHYCGKKFRFSQNLKEHTYIHTNELPYVCGVNGCLEAFRHQSKLSLHRRMHPGYQPRKYHYLCSDLNEYINNSMEEKNFIGQNANSKNNLNLLDKGGEITRFDDSYKENGELDYDFLNYLLDIIEGKEMTWRPTLPYPRENEVK